jgi:NAD+ diphosphatase
LPRKKDIPGLSGECERTYLFSLNETACFLVWNYKEELSNEFVFKEINFFRTFKQPEIAWISIVGFHLMNWYSQNKYCGSCGAKTNEKSDERAIVCPKCSNIIFPKISPAIIVAIISGNKILLAKNANFRANWYSLIAGYADVGESLEETVKREVKEEVGIDVSNIHYYKSQPWPFSGSMMIGFFAEANENQTVTPDKVEITDAQWFERGSLPNHPPAISIAGEMIDKFEKGDL